MARGRRRAAAGEVRKAPRPDWVEPRQPAAAPSAKPSCPLPSIEELLAAVESLYEDQLRPYGRILKKRLAERATDGGNEEDGSPAGCDAGELRRLCETCEALRVQSEEGGEWSALLVSRPEDFIDIYNPKDVYPEALWKAAEDYFQHLGHGPAEALPGGRYTSAVALAARQLPFLQGRSLGQVCHIMQIAIAQRKLLGYFNGAIVPYESSTSMMKSRCAQEQRPLDASVTASSAEGAPLIVATWETAREKLQQILESAVERGSEQVPLSNVKRLFRSLYDMELSETALGHSKLTELLQDRRFQDICSVQLKDRGYVVVPVGHGEACWKEELPGDGARHLRGLEGSEAGRRSQSLPKDMGSVVEPAEARSPPSVRSAGNEPAAGTAAAQEDPRERLKFCIDEPLCLEEAGFGNVVAQSPGFPLMTPSPSYDHASQPLGRTSWEATCQALGLVPWPKESANPPDEERRKHAASTSSPRSRPKFCPQEPLCIEEEEEVLSTPCRDPVLPYPIMTPSPQYRDCLSYQAGRWSFSEVEKRAQ